MKVLKYIFQGIGLIASIGLFLLGLTVSLYSLAEGAHAIVEILQFNTSESSVIYDAMGVVDLILLSFSIFIASIGIYELFVQPVPSLPDWIQINDLDALKAMLIKVAIVVMGISFMGRLVTWDGEQNLLNLGLATGAVVVALSYFLSVKSKSVSAKEKH